MLWQIVRFPRCFAQFIPGGKTVTLLRHSAGETSSLNCKTLMVTGAAGSLGSALSHAAAARGFNLVLLDSDCQGLERLYDRLVEAGFSEPALQLTDLATVGPDDLQEIVAAVEEQFGGLDALVHCAARFDSLTPLEHVPPEEWLLSIQVNLNAAWLLSALCLPLLRKAGHGHLYFLLEDMDEVGGALWGPYGISKHALRALVGQLALECQTAGVRVLGINPGPMQSPLRSRAYLAEHPASAPSPSVAAEQIVELLLGTRQPSGTCLDLAGMDVDARA
jgi:NAD(P)-dependent dehydrogenase (short-subunit alcohol dehydrogenase family)